MYKLQHLILRTPKTVESPNRKGLLGNNVKPKNIRKIPGVINGLARIHMITLEQNSDSAGKICGPKTSSPCLSDFWKRIPTSPASPDNAEPCGLNTTEFPKAQRLTEVIAETTKSS
jgi:hypothetical protein